MYRSSFQRESSAGTSASNPLPYHEVHIHGFDALLIFLAITVMNVTHPDQILAGPDSELLKAVWRKRWSCVGRAGEKRCVDDEHAEMDPHRAGGS